MSLILHIDTALGLATVSLSGDGRLIRSEKCKSQKDHASWINVAIADLFFRTDIRVNQLDAVAVNIGPGSYTGLRVGLSTAKGLCYALGIPLITVSSLEILAESVKEEATDLICPLIDARRMEVFTAVYDKNMTIQRAPQAMILDKNSFSDLLSEHPVLFCGDGAEKLKQSINHPAAAFTSYLSTTEAFIRLSQKFLLGNTFADLAYSEPLYIKEFYTAARKE